MTLLQKTLKDSSRESEMKKFYMDGSDDIAKNELGDFIRFIDDSKSSDP